ncbi:esterase-like activity of phytase family protein [Myceligenerans crystallogenes]|uniref:Esterase-like activity of phytase family protein n=1 Tax=Myceligenerans crystallogenes TaxID=316335 RepID=A0ABP4ZQR3_9MICO
MHTQKPSRRTSAFIATGAALALSLTALVPVVANELGQHRKPGAGQSTPYTQPKPGAAFHRLATYPVFGNVPAGVDPADETVAEISTVSEDGNTVIYTDAAGKRIGFVDITDPANPRGAGSLSLAELGNAEDEPTSVVVVGGYVLVVVNTSESYADPSGRLDVVDLATRTRVRSIDLGGQPDSISLSKDRSRAVIAMENERDEEFTPEGGDEGDLPQAPGGFVQLLDLPGADPAAWSTRKVAFAAEDGTPLPVVADAGIDTPQDVEPEYVSVNPSGTTAVVTLQENNGIALIDLASGEITDVFSAGEVALTGVDTVEDGDITLTGSLEAAPREPDSVAWIDDTRFATANEGDWKGGTRGWTIFDTDGDVVWDAGNTLEHLAARVGLHNEGRVEKKGVEIEGLSVGELGGVRYAFVGSERSNFVAVYDLSDPASPRFTQVLATTNGPEGILPVPQRDLLVVSSEEDAAKDGVRATVSVFGRGDAFARSAGTPRFPSVVSADDGAGAPIGWTALGALSADPRDERRLWTASDAARTPTSLYSLRLAGKGRPAVIDREIAVTEGGAPASFDVEGLWARPGRTGGFWLGSEGATGAGNALVRVSADGVVQERVALPADVAAGLGKWGIEGVAGVVDRKGEHLFVALQRGLTTDAGGLGGSARIGRYDVATGAWTWFAYPLSAPTASGDWIGLSEVTVVDRDTLAVIERDKLNGPAAALKGVYTVNLPKRDPAAGTVAPLRKQLAIDVLPRLRATNGWTQEKLEGFTIGTDGRAYAVTDNDGVDDATGETVFLDLGPADRYFR